MWETRTETKTERRVDERIRNVRISLNMTRINILNIQSGFFFFFTLMNLPETNGNIEFDTNYSITLIFFMCGLVAKKNIEYVCFGFFHLRLKM